MKKLVLPLFWLFALLFITHSTTFANAKSTPEDDCSWSAPLNLRDSLRGATSMFVNWDTPVEGVPPGGYIVKVFQGASVSPFNTIPTQQLFARLDNLTPGTDYRIEVSSVCGNGETGPAALVNLPTIVVELVSYGELFGCIEPSKKPTQLLSDYYNLNVPYCYDNNNDSDPNNDNPYCYFTNYPIEILGSAETEIYNFLVYKNGTANKFFWGVIERAYDSQGKMHFKIKRKDATNTFSVEIINYQYLVIKLNGVSFANIGFMADEFTFTKMYQGTPNLVVFGDKYSECGNQSSLLSYNINQEDNYINYLSLDRNTGDKIICFPNPVIDFLNLYFTLDTKTPTRISIFDINGVELIKTSYTGSIINGMSNEIIDIQNLKSGIYTICVNNGSEKIFNKFIKLL